MKKHQLVPENINLNSTTNLSHIITLMPGNVYWKDRQGYYQGCNDNVARLLKLNSPKDIIGKKIHELIEKDYAEKIDKIDNEVMSTGKEFVIEENGLDINGKPAIYLTRKIPIFNNDQEIIGLVGISFDITERKEIEHELIGVFGVTIDITERKQMEEELLKTKEETEIANLINTELIRNLDSNIRTPLLNGILNYIGELYKKERETVKRRFLETFIEHIQRLLKYCNDNGFSDNLHYIQAFNFSLNSKTRH